MRWLLLLLAIPAYSQDLSEPQYFLPGVDYSQDSIAINDMLRNIANENKNIKNIINQNNTWTGTNDFLSLTFGGIPVSTTTLPSYFESSEQTITANTVISVAHGLGGVPRWFQATIRCKTAEYGYAIDDELLISVATNLVGGDSPNVFVNATNIGFVVDEGIGGMTRTTTAGQQFTNANWRVILRAWR